VGNSGSSAHPRATATDRSSKLQAAIKRFLAETNDNPKPFVWTTDPEKIIADGA
jgi:hypothetical protein